MGYAYDIFLSYKRDRRARPWLVERFQPTLEYYVGLELGAAPAVFRDEQEIEAGVTWPEHLGAALGNSRVMVALWTRTYFHSPWCTRELAAMLARGGTVVPVVLHDCEALPLDLQQIQTVALQKFFNIDMQPGGALNERFTEMIAQQLAPAVANAIHHASDWREHWPAEAEQRFRDAFFRGVASQRTVPRMGM